MSIFPRSYPPKLLLALGRQQRTVSEQGLSLTECLVAIIILALLGLAITPPMFLAAGTRVQARRADQANQIAQSEIDRIRSVIERGSSTITASDLPAIATVTNLKDAAAATPTTTVSATSPLLTNSKCSSSSLYPTNVKQVPVSSVVLVDQDGDCTPDYMMQVFRTQGNAATVNDVPTNFQIGVRVYAITQGATSQTLMTDRTASLIIGTGPKDKVSGNRRRPLSVLYSTVTRSDTSGGLGGLCRQLGGTDTTCK